WMVRFPHKVKKIIAIATSYFQQAQNIAFHEAGRQTIMADPDWKKGKYYDYGAFPVQGLSVARMIAHVTYLAGPALHEKFGRRLQARNFRSYEFGSEFQIESYLQYQGRKFSERFDPNSYLYITKAVDYFDQAGDFAGDLNQAYRLALSD